MWAFLQVLLLAAPSYALHESDVGVVDWHKQLIGVPVIGTAVTAPIFHSVPGTDTNLILTATGNNVLAALNSTDGAVAWRSVYEPDDRISSFYKHGNSVATLSGPGGSTLRLFDALTGHLILEKRLHDPELGHLPEPQHVANYIAFDTDTKSIYALTKGHTVAKTDSATKEILWTWSAPDQTSLTIYSDIVPTPDATYVVGLSKSFADYTLHITALNSSTGALLLDGHIPSAIKDSGSYLALTSANPTSTPHVLWLENGLLKSFSLTPDLKSIPAWLQKKGGKTSFTRFADVGLSAQGYVVAIEEDGTEHLVGIEGGNLKEFWELNAGDREERTESLWAGGIDVDAGEMFVSRIYWVHPMQRMKVDTFKIGAAAPVVNELTMFFPFDTVNHGIINHARLLPNTASILFTTSTGAVQSWHLGTTTDEGGTKRAAPQEKWTREESLATATVAEFVELPEAQTVDEKGKGPGKEEGVVQRLSRQIGDAKNFPQYAVNFVNRFVTGTPATTTSPTRQSITNGTLTRDPFGFRQVLVIGTGHGKMFGLDASNGEILWSRVFGLGWVGEVGGTVTPIKIHGGFGEQGRDVVMVTQRRASNSLVDTVIFHIDALTGADARAAANAATQEPIEGFEIIQGPIVDAFLLDPATDASLAASNQPKPKTKKEKKKSKYRTTASTPVPTAKAFLLLDEFLQVYPYPDTPETQATLTHYADSLYFPLRAGTDDGKSVPGSGQKRLLGHKLQLNNDLSDKYVAYPTWTFSLPKGEDIRSLVPPFRSSGASRSGAASFGKVLGNRTTLYKYLNPRMVVMLSAPHTPAAGKMCGVYVLDSAKGTVVYRAALPAVEGQCDVKVSLVENWLVYHYYDVGGEAKGWRVVTVELYEGNGVDQKTRSLDMSAYSSGNTNVLAFEQSYVYPHAITALAPTTTKFGITSKDLIVASRNHQIQSIQRLLLNPRRPNRKTTSEEQEEFLVPYEPVIAYDPRRVLSHNYEVANVHKIVTSPALLESTSLVFAFGLDMFLTRVTPSGEFDVLSENFNKAQLVFTVLGLALAIAITRPMVRRKQLRERWYQ